MKNQTEKYHPRINGIFITKAFLTVVVVLIFFILPVLAYSADLTLAWDANNEPDLAGYKLYYGTSSGNYPNHVDVGDTLQHTLTGLNEGATYYFAATAYDNDDNESGYSEEISYTIPSLNNPPDTPTTPSGPTSGNTQTSYNFSTSGSDPDGNAVQFRFDWGDGQISNWGQASQTHSWAADGNYCVKAQAKDELDALSGWSSCHNVDISTPAQNHNPNTPAQPSGPTSGNTQTNYTFSTTATDPDGDLLTYSFDWGDGATSSWGASSQSHSWSSAGTYCVKARARDTGLATSAWSACRNISIGVTADTHTITATAGDHGSISPAGTVAVNHGDNRSFSIYPNFNYHIADVVVDGTSVGAVTSYTFTNVSANHSISASFAANNQPPVADAGADQSAPEGSVVSLNGSNSFDPVGSIAGYLWEQTAGTSVSISSAHSQIASFTAPVVGSSGESLTFRLTVTDSEGLTDVDFCTISVIPPAVRDSDGDGVPDDQDAFPLDGDEWLDSDGDGIGNNADTDDDNDGMPDVWEEQYGLDPLVNDANEDPDGDGVSNIDEYLAGTDPTQDDYNEAPDAPVVLIPQNSDLVSLVPTIQTDEFYDSDPGDTHLKTQWQIFDELSDERMLDIETTASLTSLTVPKLILEENTVYYCRVRFFDNHGTPSEWSESVAFETDLNAEDTNGNGIPDSQELDLETDMDDNGVPDADQDSMKCLNAEGDETYLCLGIEQSPNIINIDSVAYENPQSLIGGSNDQDKPDTMQFGLIHFKLQVSNPGDEVVLKIYLSQRAEDESSWYKYDSVENRWHDFWEYVTFAPDERSLTLTITDGGFADADGIANGIIVDPSGVGATSSQNNESGLEELIESLNLSCFITTAAHRPASAQPKNLWSEIRGRELAIIFIALVLVYAARLVAYRIRHMWTHIRHRA